MKQRVKILSDSTCDLSAELKEKYGVDIIPLHVILGDQVYEDGVNVKPEEIYAWVEKNKDAPKTSAPTPEEVEEIFQKYLDIYPDIICFSIADGMSASNATMHLAAQKMDAEDRIHVIDSANLSTGIGLMVLEAAEMAMEGHNADEIISRVEQLKPLVRASFVVDTLMYLYRGGRCSGLSAFAGQALKLHPMISVVNGEMIAGKKYRGNIERVIMDYARELEGKMKQAKPKRVFITHSGCSQEIEQQVYDYLKSLNYFQEICITRAGGVVTCHCGPGTLGVLFISESV